MASAIKRSRTSFLTALSLGLLSFGISSCNGAWRQRIGIEKQPVAEPLPEVSDGPRSAPLKP